MTTLPKHLEEKMNEMAEEFGVEDIEKYGDLPNLFQGVHYRKGFQACASLLLPEIEKMEKALEYYRENDEGTGNNETAIDTLADWQKWKDEK